MSPQVEKIITALTTIALGIVGVAFLVALVSNKSYSPQVLGALSSGFACDLAAAMGQGNKCGSSIGSSVRVGVGAGGTSVNSGVNYGCTTVDGVQYCP